MKKAQTTVEYIVYAVLVIVLLSIFTKALWNRKVIINGSTFGTEVQGHGVHVAPMINENEIDDDNDETNSEDSD